MSTRKGVKANVSRILKRQQRKLQPWWRFRYRGLQRGEVVTSCYHGRKNFWMTTNRKRHLKCEFGLFQASSILFNFIQFVKCWRHFLGLNPKGPYLSLEKEREHFCVVFTYSIKRTCEIRKFHVAVVQRRLRNVQKSVMHVQLKGGHLREVVAHGGSTVLTSGIVNLM